MTVWFTSDTHFCHQKVAELRGFTNPDDHGEAVVDNWNSLVRKDDIVWLLGDVGVGHDTEILKWVGKLNGHKHLITGNHDSCHPMHRNARKNQARWLLEFDSVQAFAKTSVCGEDYLMSHFPYEGDHGDKGDRATQYRLRDEGFNLLHGHTHSDAPPVSRVDSHGQLAVVHVGMDAWGLAPVKDVEIKDAVIASVLRRYYKVSPEFKEKTAEFMDGNDELLRRLED